MVGIIVFRIRKDIGKENGQPLKAPQRGELVRIIHESATCHALYRFTEGKRTLFTFTTRQAFFEYEYPY